jgi:hypothetical protein
MGAAASQMDATGAELDEEQDEKALEPDCLHGEEVDGENLMGVLAEEGSPGAAGAFWCWREPMPA